MDVHGFTRHCPVDPDTMHVAPEHICMLVYCENKQRQNDDVLLFLRTLQTLQDGTSSTNHSISNSLPNNSIFKELVDNYPEKKSIIMDLIERIGHTMNLTHGDKHFDLIESTKKCNVYAQILDAIPIINEICNFFTHHDDDDDGIKSTLKDEFGKKHRIKECLRTIMAQDD